MSISKGDLSSHERQILEGATEIQKEAVLNSVTSEKAILGSMGSMIMIVKDGSKKMVKKDGTVCAVS